MSPRQVATAPRSLRARAARVTAAALLLLAAPLGCGKAVTRAVLAEAAGAATKYVGEEVLNQQRARHQAALSGHQPGQPFGSPTAVLDLHGARTYQYNASHQF